MDEAPRSPQARVGAGRFPADQQPGSREAFLRRYGTYLWLFRKSGG
jgi:hypothetical protein